RTRSAVHALNFPYNRPRQVVDDLCQGKDRRAAAVNRRRRPADETLRHAPRAGFPGSWHPHLLLEICKTAPHSPLLMNAYSCGGPEVLEARIAPASTLTYIDVDGDRVTITSSVGDLGGKAQFL